jgi:hypothetical protein
MLTSSAKLCCYFVLCCLGGKGKQPVKRSTQTEPESNVEVDDADNPSREQLHSAYKHHMKSGEPDLQRIACQLLGTT